MPENGGIAQARVELRHAAVSDANDVARVQVEGWKTAYQGILPPAMLDTMTLPAQEEFWRTKLEAGAFSGDAALIVAEVDSCTDGFICFGPTRDDDLEPRTGEVYAVYVNPTCWRHGIGSALLSHALQRLRCSGSHVAVLWVLEGNQRARAFYATAGWLPDEAKRGIRGAPGIFEVRYRYDLQPQ